MYFFHYFHTFSAFQATRNWRLNCIARASKSWKTALLSIAGADVVKFGNELSDCMIKCKQISLWQGIVYTFWVSIKRIGKTSPGSQHVIVVVLDVVFVNTFFIFLSYVLYFIFYFVLIIFLYISYIILWLCHV